MSITYQVKSFADSFNKESGFQEKIRDFITNAYNAFIINRSKEQKRMEDKENRTFYIYLVDVDRIKPDPFRTLLANKLEEQVSILGLTETGGGGIFLFLSKSKSYITWSDSTNSEGHKVLKEIEFYIRTFKSYQLGKFASYNAVGKDSKAITGELTTILSELADQHAKDSYDKRHTKIKSICTILEEIHEDVSRLYNIARCEKLPYVNDNGSLEGDEVNEDDKKNLTSYVPSATLNTFLKTLDILYQIGRHPYNETDSITTEINWLKGYGGSFALKQGIDGLLEKLSSQGSEGSSSFKMEQMLFKLRAYEVYRDLARWMSSGARHWINLLPVGLKVLIIDENLEKKVEDNSSERLYRNRLERIHEALGKSRISVFYVSQSGLEKLQESIGNLKAIGKIDANNLFSGELVQQTDLSSYHIILVEVEFSKAYLGPGMVQRLAVYLDQNRRAVPYRSGIIVLSRKENYGLIQQCLNLGADAYVMKERVYALPARMAQARVPIRWMEPRGRKSNFRSLYQLQPQDIVKLHNQRINGNSWNEIDRQWIKALPKADLHTHIGTCISLETIEALSFNTSGYLLTNIKKREKSAGKSDGREKAESHIISSNLALKKLEETIERICQVVIWAGVLHKARVLGDSYPPVKLLWTAANTVLEMEGVHDENNLSARELPDRDVYDALFRRLAHPDLQLASFEVCSLLVAAISMTGGIYPDDKTSMFSSNLIPKRDYLKAIQNRIGSKWMFIKCLQEWANEYEKEYQASSKYDEDESAQRIWVQSLLENTIKQCQIITKTAWSRALTENWVGENFSTSEPWQKCFEMVTQRTNRAVEKLNYFFEQALIKLRPRIDDVIVDSGPYKESLKKARDMLINMTTWPAPFKDFAMPALSEFVKIPENPDTKDQTLLRYLWGAGLLGADHLQYPENIILACKDIVNQAVEDNITYSEIRCATNGYSAGGMSGVDVTDLLCYSFDTAMAYSAIKEEKHKWVRINILLGAKRNKSEEEFQEIVSLLSFYLQRGERKRHELEVLEKKLLSQIAPNWWKPCQVVGFDLSGDESIHPRRSEEMMKPLFKLSASITIHAGEAATAENIWNAVYHFGAWRIGHGLRLRENKRLLNYCINEGVCIEMCPISNQFTNGFVELDDLDEYDGSWREHYPLRYSLEQGLDVCISTDNRQLHGGRTLVDDYLCGARMSGGLTKWEILKLIKAGFKHAFIQKSDVEVLLTAMEDEVYNLVISKKAENL